jgi:hypothetical protein
MKEKNGNTVCHLFSDQMTAVCIMELGAGKDNRKEEIILMFFLNFSLPVPGLIDLQTILFF